ncbi:MAG: hypothetical protein Q9227_009271 [Pyrenula ochraceoflavens]
MRWFSRVGSLALVSQLCYAVSEPADGNILRRQESGADVIYNTRFENVTWSQTKWQLGTTTLDQGHYQSRMAVANGYTGINVAALGPFFEVDTPVDGDNINGWPLFSQRQTFATIGGFYDSQPDTNGSNYPWLNQYGGESVISGIPHWSGIIVDMGADKYLDASTDSATISNFTTMLDMKNGLMNWAFTWAPNNNVSFNIDYQMFAHKLYVNQALVKMSITSTIDQNVIVANVLNGDSAVRTDFVDKGADDKLIYSAVSPHGIGNVKAFVYATMQSSGAAGSPGSAACSSDAPIPEITILADRPYLGNNRSSIAQGSTVALSAGVPVVFTKYVGLASSDAFVDPQTTARAAALTASGSGYEASLKSHMDEWAQIFSKDSVDDYTFPENGTLPEDNFIVEQAITAVTNPYSLLQNTVGANAIAAANNAPINEHSIAVGGLASDSYAGLIFWDAEVWMQPGMVAAFPQAAQGIAKYRVARYAQAKANAKTAYQSSKNDTTFTDDAAVFSWTSGRFGTCTGTGPCFDYEYHINGDIAQEFVNYYVASGDMELFQDQLFPVYNSIAHFFSQVMTKNGSQFSLTNMTDPDEYANQVDNGGFTMPLIADTLRTANMFRSSIGMEVNDTWEEQAQNVVIERNPNAMISLEYSGMNGSIAVKQADVVLKTFPLRFDASYTQGDALSDLDYYAAKQSLNGPGMTYAIFAIDANQVSASGCSAYTYQQYSTNPYARAPWFQFSEQLLDDYTANGGTHPAYPFLTGHGGAYQVVLFGYLGFRLVPDSNLHVDPALPPQIPQLKYRTFYWQGWPISAFSNYTHTTLTRLPTPFSAANMTYAASPISVLVGNGAGNTSTYSLPPNGTITLPNRQYGSMNTVAGNLVQCKPVTSPNKYEPGQFPLAAVDGAASTKWQPSLANESASITVSLPIGEKITGFYFDWAQNPPLNFTVSFHNTTVGMSLGLPEQDEMVVSRVKEVAISKPYNASEANLLVPYSSNITRTVLDSPVWAAQYATLTIIGNQAIDDPLNGTGASVAEWAVLGEEGENLSIPAGGAIMGKDVHQRRASEEAELLT